MKIKKKQLIIIGILLAVAGLIPVLFTTWFLVEKEPPISKGKVSFHVHYTEAGTFEQSLDIYKPTQRTMEPSPVVMFLHGGAWLTGDKLEINMNRFNGAINNLRAHGFTIIAPNYTVAITGTSPFPDCVHDVYHAIEWTREHKDSLGVNMDDFTLMGESAGAHLAMLCAYASPADFDLDYTKVEAARVINVSGPSDLYTLYHSGKIDTANAIINRFPDHIQDKIDLPEILLGFDPSKSDSATKSFASRYSPTTYLDANAPPTLIIHGTKDVVVPKSQSDSLAILLNDNKVFFETHYLENVNHAFFGASKNQKDSVQSWISDFVLEE